MVAGVRPAHTNSHRLRSLLANAPAKFNPISSGLAAPRRVNAFPKKSRLLLLGLLLLFTTIVWLVYLNPSSSPEDISSAPTSLSIQEAPGSRVDLQAREQAADNTYWAKEMLAQACGRTFESFWDSLNASSNKLGLIARFPLREIILPKWEPPETLSHSIVLRNPSGKGPALTAGEWHQQVENLLKEGWQVGTIELRHNRFDTDEHGQPWRSHFFFRHM